MIRHPLASSALRLAALAALGASLAACSPAPAPQEPPDATYAVRGEIARLPDGGAGEVWIRHEAIPSFKNDKGAEVGMDSMTMPFPLAPGVSLDGFSAGDRIRFEFEVRWRGEGRPMAITRLERLPDGTRLGFDPPAGESEEEGQPEGAEELADEAPGGGSSIPK